MIHTLSREFYRVNWHSRPSRACCTGLVRLTPCVTTSVPTWLAEVRIQRRRQAQECLAGCLMLSWVISTHLFQCSGSERPRRTWRSPVTSLSGPVCPHFKVRGSSSPRVQQTEAAFQTPPAGPFPLGSQGSQSLSCSVMGSVLPCT